MNCNEAQQTFGVYWDLPDDDVCRLQLRKHISQCQECAEEFKVWEESTSLIRSIHGNDERPAPNPSKISGRVMNRIYEAESWRIPVPDRLYSITYRMRRNFSVAIILCLLLFSSGLIYSLLVDFESSNHLASNSDFSIYGIHPAASTTVSSESMNVHSLSSAVASLSDPFLLKMGPIHTLPDYLLAISIVGMVSTLLIMNWMSRTEA